MDPRNLLRPLPLFLIFLFVAVAVADLVQTLTEDPLPPETVESAAPRFLPEEPVIDFRSTDEDAAVQILPTLDLESERWSARTPLGAWAKGSAAELSIDLAVGNHRTLFFECRPGGGKRPVRSVRVTVNQVDCGEVALHPGWGSYRIVLPQGAIRFGPNTVGFSFKERKEARKIRRALLVRKVGLALDLESGVEVLEKPRPVTLHNEAEKIVIRAAGTLEIPLQLEDRTDALRMRYRFSSDLGRAEVVVQMREGKVGIGDSVKASVSADRKLNGNLRIPLHGRRGAYVLRIQATPGEPGSQLLVSSLRLVEEGDPTGRPWSANPLRN